jgi:anion-transporting  ArsA/GET3 family ATPase
LCSDEFREYDPYFLLTSFIMNFSMLSEENYDNELLENFLELSKNFNKELKKVKEEKESLILKLSESHALIDYLKSENTMLFDIIDTLENKLKESEDLLKNSSNDNLKSMLCNYLDISNKLDLMVDDLSASDSELDSIVIKHVIVDTACLDNSENSFLKNCVKPKFKDIGTQAHGKFVPTCHNCGNVSHIRPNCFLLKIHRSLIK